MAEVQKDGLVGYWSFDEGQGTTAYDGSGKGNNGVLLPASSEPQWVNGKFGNALQFNGVNNYVNVTNSASLSGINDATFVMWIRVNAPLSTYEIFYEKSGSWNFLVNNANSIEWWIWFNGVGRQNIFYVAPAWNVGEWNQFVFFRKAGIENDLYKNGILLASNTNNVNSVVSSSTNNVHIGSGPDRGGANGQGFNGIIDEVKIYNKALTPDDTISLRAA
ncbi:Concanavalin A-like lectin/glucanases superfamily protein [uncultured archaeon]|nr:Concanavalin A-like lectin/glucanases superfamily protein [uncultured archaeon]